MLLYGRGTHTPEAGIEHHRVGSQLGVYTHAAMSRLIDREGYCSRRAAGSAINWLKIFRPDVVHLHNIHGHYMHVPMLLDFLAKAEIPVVVTMHDFWLLTGRCAFPLGCDKWQTICKSCPAKSLYPTTLFSNCTTTHKVKTHLVNHLPDVTLVCPTRYVEEQVKKSNLKYCPTVVIPNGVDTSIYKPDGTRAKKGAPFRILAVANKWEQRKHPDHVTALAGILQEDEELVIVGLDPKLQPEHPRVHTFPLIAAEEQLAALYRSADILVNPSEAETYGMTVAEALACGTPVIVPPEGALAEVATPLGGVTADFSDPSNIASIIADIRSSAPQLVTPPDVNLMTSKYLTLFDSLAK